MTQGVNNPRLAFPSWSPPVPSGEDDPEDLDYAMVHPEGDRTGVSGGVGRRLPGMHGVTFYVRVSDPQGTLDTVQRHGGRTVTPPLRIGPETVIARFADPAGNVIGLVAG